MLLWLALQSHQLWLLLPHPQPLGQVQAQLRPSQAHRLPHPLCQAHHLLRPLLAHLTRQHPLLRPSQGGSTTPCSHLTGGFYHPLCTHYPLTTLPLLGTHRPRTTSLHLAKLPWTQLWLPCSSRCGHAMQCMEGNAEAFVYACVHVCMHVYVCLHACMCVCMYVCVCVYVCRLGEFFLAGGGLFSNPHKGFCTPCGSRTSVIGEST